MKTLHLLASLAIIACTMVAWFILGFALTTRTASSSDTMAREVSGVWNPALEQQHPEAWFDTPNAPGGRAVLLPSSSNIAVDLAFVPKKRGLFWHQTYDVGLQADYVFTNPTRIPQTVYVTFPLPANAQGLERFEFRLGDDTSGGKFPAGGSAMATQAVVLPASGCVTLHAGYQTRGTGSWIYRFTNNQRIAGFTLKMKTDFTEINFPVGTGSPKDENREPVGKSWILTWKYPDVLAAQSIGMEMPKLLNAGPVASRIAFYAPVSLLFFVTIVMLIGALKGVPLHPMQVFFVCAGFFSFHLVLAYLVDLLPLVASFALATVISLALVCGYLRAVGGNTLFKVAVPAQFAYLVLFSLSFFFDGLTGITLTACAVATLALLMILTAKVDWRAWSAKPLTSGDGRPPPPLPVR
jgi:hypothetical protein